MMTEDEHRAMMSEEARAEEDLVMFIGTMAQVVVIFTALLTLMVLLVVL